MKLNRRIDKLTERVAEATNPNGPLVAGWIADLEARIAILQHVPDDLQRAVDKYLTSDTEEAWASFRLWPFAKWAPPMADDYQFPRSLIEWMLDPPHDFWMGANCERCGLAVPLYTACRPDSPANLRAFPICPACGGRTSFAASYQKGPKIVTEGETV